MRWTGRFAGSFYPERREELEELLRTWMDDEPPTEERVLGVLVPHAGYVYSGLTAARAMARAREDHVETVFVLALSHRQPIDGVVLLDVEGFETPLGPVEVDSSWRESPALQACGVRAVEPFAEHSLEVQLPLVRRTWPGAKVVPLVFGNCGIDTLREVGRVLARELGPRRRVLATTDLSHYHDREVARRLDDEFTREFAAVDVDGLVEALEEGRAEACGYAPVLAFMEMTRSLSGRIEIVDRRDSGDAFGETQRVVGYVSALSVAGTRGAPS